MKNLIVLYTTFLLLSLFSSCTKKDKPVVYPTTGGPVNPATVSGSLGIGPDSKPISDFSKSGQVMSFKTATHSVEITFNNSNFADQTYTTKASVTADNEVTIKVKDLGNGEIYLVENDVELSIQTVTSNGITANMVLFAFGEAVATVDPTRSPVNVSFGITSTK